MSMLKCYCKYCGNFSSQPRFFLSDAKPVAEEFLTAMQDKNGAFEMLGHKKDNHTDDIAAEWLRKYGIATSDNDTSIPDEVKAWIAEFVVIPDEPNNDTDLKAALQERGAEIKTPEIIHPDEKKDKRVIIEWLEKNCISVRYKGKTILEKKKVFSPYTVYSKDVKRITCAPVKGKQSNGTVMFDVVEADSTEYKNYLHILNPSRNPALEKEIKGSLARINHLVAFMQSEKTGGLLPVTALACGNCHLILDIRQIDYRTGITESGCYFKTDGDKSIEYRIMPVAPSYSGKTVLLLAVYHMILNNTTGFTVECKDTYFRHYFSRACDNIFSYGLLPDTTSTYQPPLTIRSKKEEEREVLLSLIDTMGEIVNHANDKANPDYAASSDALIVLYPITSEFHSATSRTTLLINKTRDRLIDLNLFLSDVQNRIQKISKPVMLLFNKCDLYLHIAEEIMLTWDDDTDEDVLSLARQFNFYDNRDTIQNEICDIIIESNPKNRNQLVADDLKEKTKRLIILCDEISKQNLRIQCISPIGNSFIDPSEGIKSKSKYVEDFVKMLFEFYKEISK